MLIASVICGWIGFLFLTHLKIDMRADQGWTCVIIFVFVVTSLVLETIYVIYH